MFVTINGKEYEPNISFATLIHFAGTYRASVYDLLTKLDEPETPPLLFRLLHCGIANINMTFSEFMELAGSDQETFNQLYLAALMYAREIININETKSKRKGNAKASTQSIEISFLAIGVAMGIDTDLMKLLPFSAVYDTVMQICEAKGGSQSKKFKKMASNEIYGMYTGANL